jgi:methylmalonyl-CoA mutase N-terminal domain/subunit
VEALTNEVEARACGTWKIDRMGGAVAAIEQGFYQDEIHEAAFEIQRGIESGERVVVGVNRFEDPKEQPVDVLQIGEDEVAAQIERLRDLRASRDQGAVDRRLADIQDAALETTNLVPPIREALRARATLGEVSDVLRTVFGEYHPR